MLWCCLYALQLPDILLPRSMLQSRTSHTGSALLNCSTRVDRKAQAQSKQQMAATNGLIIFSLICKTREDFSLAPFICAKLRKCPAESWCSAQKKGWQTVSRSEKLRIMYWTKPSWSLLPNLQAHKIQLEDSTLMMPEALTRCKSCQHQSVRRS